MKTTHTLTRLLTVLVMLCLFALPAHADEILVETHTLLPDVDLPDSDELFAGYVEQQFYAGTLGGISTFSTGNRTAGSQLTGDAKTLYDALVPYIRDIANGKRTNTHIGFGSQIDVKINNVLTTLVPDQALTFEGADFTDEQCSQC